uniref:Uncharacterized protein n=1 Tax=Sphaerodactylus townsendi TaxID=933632 RepID=A0ACB8EQG9_9SAUR
MPASEPFQTCVRGTVAIVSILWFQLFSPLPTAAVSLTRTPELASDRVSQLLSLPAWGSVAAETMPGKDYMLAIILVNCNCERRENWEVCPRAAFIGKKILSLKLSKLG